MVMRDKSFGMPFNHHEPCYCFFRDWSKLVAAAEAVSPWNAAFGALNFVLGNDALAGLVLYSCWHAGGLPFRR